MAESPESGVVIVETVDEDSDDEDTADTEVITRYGEVGQLLFDEAKCLVRLSNKLGDSSLLCG